MLQEKDLFEAVHAATKQIIIFDCIDFKEYREQIGKNRFEAKVLQKLEESMKKDVIQHHESLTEKVQQNRSYGMRF